jgi:hypothetical protein
MESVRWPKAPPGTEAYIQIPHVKLAAMDTTISVPDQRAALLRLRAKEHPAPTTHPAEDDEVLLLVRPRIIQARPGTAALPLLTARPTTTQPTPSGEIPLP